MPANHKGITRRNFSKLSATALAGMPFIGLSNTLIKETPAITKDLKIHLFSKHLQFLDYNEMSDAAATMGFAGLDLTVRPKGHVIPERVVDDLPKAAAAIKKHGLDTTLLTTNVWDATDAMQKNVLETASKQGFSHYRTAWLTYPENRSISDSQTLYSQQAKALELANKNLGLIGCYQNHAGKHVGAPIWDLLPILSPTKNEYIGCQYDIRHAVVEGGQSWELGFRQIAPYIKSVVLKDFKWGQVDGKWKPINVPLGQGMVDFKRYFTLLKEYNISVPISLHLEYDLGGAEHGSSTLTIPQKEVFAKMKKDLNFIQKTWQQTE